MFIHPSDSGSSSSVRIILSSHQDQGNQNSHAKSYRAQLVTNQLSVLLLSLSPLLAIYADAQQQTIFT